MLAPVAGVVIFVGYIACMAHTIADIYKDVNNK